MKQFWKSMLKSPSGVVGLVILVLAISIAVFGPMLFTDTLGPSAAPDPS